MQARLSTAKKPANIVFTDYLPRNAYGKLADRTTQRNQADRGSVRPAANAFERQPEAP